MKPKLKLSILFLLLLFLNQSYTSSIQNQTKMSTHFSIEMFKIIKNEKKKIVLEFIHSYLKKLFQFCFELYLVSRLQKKVDDFFGFLCPFQDISTLSKNKHDYTGAVKICHIFVSKIGFGNY